VNVSLKVLLFATPAPPTYQWVELWTNLLIPLLPLLSSDSLRSTKEAMNVNHSPFGFMFNTFPGNARTAILPAHSSMA
jgi:hypothetical protein